MLVGFESVTLHGNESISQLGKRKIIDSKVPWHLTLVKGKSTSIGKVIIDFLLHCCFAKFRSGECLDCHSWQNSSNKLPLFLPKVFHPAITGAPFCTIPWQSHRWGPNGFWSYQAGFYHSTWRPNRSHQKISTPQNHLKYQNF